MKYKTLILIPIFTLILITSAHADTVSDLRAQLKAVLDRIALLQSELTQLEQGGSNDTECLSINSNLRPGMQSTEVQKLQIFLAKDPTVYPEGITSGYYGALTQKAVQRWQTKYGIVNFGTPYTTGYGAVGPKTRKAMQESCSNTIVAPGANNVIDFAFTTPSGTAPYTATVKLITLESACMSYKIDWGDNTESTIYNASSSVSCGEGSTTRTLIHTYNNQGNYKATLYAGKGPLETLPKVKDSYIQIQKGAPTVKVITPNGGEVLKLGDVSTISWQLSNQPENSAVTLYIVTPNGTFNFAAKPQNINNFNWIVGDNVCDGNTCDISLSPGNNYKIRAALYTLDSPTSVPNILSVDESDNTFTISQLGSGGSNPLIISNPTGNAPYTTSISIKIEPTNNAVANFELDFGDGTAKYNIHIPPGETRTVEKIIYHTYVNPGQYTVKLRSAGAANYIAKETINVTQWPFKVLPDVSVYAPATVKALVNIDTTCTNDPSGIRIYTIDWGDNTETTRYEQALSQCSNIPTQTNTIQAFTHNYLSPGIYTVTLSTNIDNNQYKTSKTVTIKKPNLVISPRFGFKPLTVRATYTADESCVMEPTTAVYTIDWGDGNNSSYSITPELCTSDNYTYTPVSKEFTHTYNSLGRYNASLTLSKSQIGTIRTSNIEVVVDTSVLRNGWRKFSTIMESGVNNLAATLTSLF